jgi:hypothetical protein
VLVIASYCSTLLCRNQIQCSRPLCLCRESRVYRYLLYVGIYRPTYLTILK